MKADFRRNFKGKKERKIKLQGESKIEVTATTTNGN